MALTNSASRYGTITKSFHWLTALLILTAIPLALIGEELPQETSDQVAVKALVYSIHKTLGVTIFFVALLRIAWALTQPKPVPVHPERQAETFLAEAVHWCLYSALIVVPLSGWIGHSAAEGFAPIYLPFADSLPFVPKSPEVEHAAFLTHWVFTNVLIGSLILHILGALKHAFIDRDGTLARMWFGRGGADPRPHAEPKGAGALLAAAIYVFGGVAVIYFSYDPTEAAVGPRQAERTGGNWQVEQGEIAITVQQMGSAIEGRFAEWSAEITFDEEPTDGSHGSVTVTIEIPSLTLGSVTDQAMSAQYFDAENHPVSTYEATILPAETGYLAQGTLSLAGQTSDVSLPFTLQIDGDTARMQGSTTLDRRNYGIGEGQSDPSTLGFEVDASIDLTATRVGG
ncbi:cytochrome b/b6 domain-containing protein [Maribius pontilimi]|uniref:Cytochrome b/b6 domain-containing protein n=1 Tax=Palleronia pontilimi TaxID=1964209 RepID=A0A934MFZ4_9RHOB|nr:cytochrome b/b6 domain-containing protein [Palleronia pontilimi]MBJ3761914.1 cytochrome b/b6 domain-containing protein [Palleronia pontilimi]